MFLLPVYLAANWCCNEKLRRGHPWQISPDLTHYSQKISISFSFNDFMFHRRGHYGGYTDSYTDFYTESLFTCLIRFIYLIIKRIS